MTPLPDWLLLPWARRNIDPFTGDMLDPINPNSINLHLSGFVRLPKPNTRPLSIWPVKPTPAEMAEYWTEPQPFSEHILRPFSLALFDTAETVSFSRWFSGLMRIRSSPARGGITTLDAGWVDSGFGWGKPSTLTLEVFNTAPYPFVLRAGQPLVNLVVFFGLPSRRHYGERQGSQYQGQRRPTPAGGGR